MTELVKDEVKQRVSDEKEIGDVLEIWIVSQGDQTADESTAKADRSHLLLTYLHYPSWIPAPDETWHKESQVFLAWSTHNDMYTRLPC